MYRFSARPARLGRSDRPNAKNANYLLYVLSSLSSLQITYIWLDKHTSLPNNIYPILFTWYAFVYKKGERNNFGRQPLGNCTSLLTWKVFWLSKRAIGKGGMVLPWNWMEPSGLERALARARAFMCCKPLNPFRQCINWNLHFFMHHKRYRALGIVNLFHEHTDSRPRYNMRMYWPNFWQPTVHVQQNIFEKTLIEVCSPHLYASFGNFCVKIGQLFEAHRVFKDSPCLE